MMYSARVPTLGDGPQLAVLGVLCHTTFERPTKVTLGLREALSSTAASFSNALYDSYGKAHSSCVGVSFGTFCYDFKFVYFL